MMYCTIHIVWYIIRYLAYYNIALGPWTRYCATSIVRQMYCTILSNRYIIRYCATDILYDISKKLYISYQATCIVRQTILMTMFAMHKLIYSRYILHSLEYQATSHLELIFWEIFTKHLWILHFFSENLLGFFCSSPTPPAKKKLFYFYLEKHILCFFR